MSHPHEPRCTGTKLCPHCKQVKHVLSFAVNHNLSDGLQSDCRDCQNEMVKRTPSHRKIAERSLRRRLFAYADGGTSWDD